MEYLLHNNQNPIKQQEFQVPQRKIRDEENINTAFLYIPEENMHVKILSTIFSTLNCTKTRRIYARICTKMTWTVRSVFLRTLGKVSNKISDQINKNNSTENCSSWTEVQYGIVFMKV